MRIAPYELRNQVKNLFTAPNTAVILSAFELEIGTIWCNAATPVSAGIIEVGPCYYLAGSGFDTSEFRFLEDKIRNSGDRISYLIPQSPEIYSSLVTYFGKNPSIQFSERHLMDIDMNTIDCKQLKETVDSQELDLSLVPIDQKLFKIAEEDRFLKNFVCHYANYEEFEHYGFGYFMLDQNTVVGGVSSYVSYQGGVEVQIAVMPQYRGKKLAQILGARFLLECKQRNLYPWWDCANPASEHVAQKLGYHLKQVTPIIKYNKGE